jgi:hypothetical protein
MIIQFHICNWETLLSVPKNTERKTEYTALTARQQWIRELEEGI